MKRRSRCLKWNKIREPFLQFAGETADPVIGNPARIVQDFAQVRRPPNRGEAGPAVRSACAHKSIITSGQTKWACVVMITASRDVGLRAGASFQTAFLKRSAADQYHAVKVLGRNSFGDPDHPAVGADRA
jgi:hypothetical protein